MAKVETIGTYQFEVLESGVTLTQTGKPQWCARLKAVTKFIESAEEIAHFQKQNLLADGQPGYVDWKAFDEEIVVFMLLFNSADTFDENTAMKNYQQLQAAFGWDGQSFETVDAFVGQIALGRVQDKKPYTNAAGKTIEGGLEVAWIDHKDASPARQLRLLESSDLKSLSAKINIAGAKAASKPAKPSSPAAPVATKPSPTPSTVTTASSAASPSAPTAPAASAPSAPAAPAAEEKKPRAKKAPAPKPPAAPVAQPADVETNLAGLAVETTMDDAWSLVNERKGDTEDSVVEEAWLSAVSEVTGGADPSTLSGQQWAKVRDITLKDIAA